MENYPGLSYPLFLGKRDIVHYDILSIYVTHGTQPRIYLPLEIWMMITDIKYVLEIIQWDNWIYSDENCRSERRYNFRERNWLGHWGYTYNNPFMGNNYASDVANTMNNILKYHTRYRCHTRKNYSFSIINIFNILKKYHNWLINVPRKYTSVLRLYNTLNKKIYELYDQYIYYNDINSCCYDHEAIIKKYITDCHYYVDNYYNWGGRLDDDGASIREDDLLCDCNMCWDFHDYVYNFDEWKLNVRGLRNGKLIYLKPDMYQNDYLTASDIM